MHGIRSYVVVTATVKEVKPITLAKPALHYYQLTKLSQALGSNWRKLGSLLVIPEQKLENITTTNKLEHNKGKEMLYEWKRTIEASAVKDFQEALKKIELVHLLEVEEGIMLYDTELKE